MRVNKSHIPKLQRHRRSGQAFVQIDGRQIQMGPWDDPSSHVRYSEFMSDWLASGRTLERPNEFRSVRELSAVYAEHARSYYQKNGVPTHYALSVARALELLDMAGLADRAPERFTVLNLTSFQHYLVRDPLRRWSRKTIKEYVSIVVAMFRHAAANRLFPEATERWRELTSIAHLKRGRAPLPGVAPPRESRKVQPATREAIEATVAQLSPTISAMVRLQVLLSMRPTEVCGLRPCDLTPVEGAWIYVVPPEHNKLEHHGHTRVIAIGPRAMEILRPWLDRCPSPDAPVFSPRVAYEDYHARRRESRRVKKWPSHDPDLRKQRRKHRKASPLPGEKYTTDSYRSAITRACDRAGVARWSPNQLRHTGATAWSASVPMDTVRAILGHRSLETTSIYVDAVPKQRADLAAAIEAARRLA